MECDELVRALRRVKAAEDARSLSSDYERAGNASRALFYALVSSLHSNDGDAILRFIECVRTCVGIEEATSLLDHLWQAPEPNAQYALALVHYLLQAGKVDRASEIEAACDPTANAPKEFLLSAIKLLVKREKYSRALEWIHALYGKEGEEFPSWAKIADIYISNSKDTAGVSELLAMFSRQSQKLPDETKLSIVLFQLRTDGGSPLIGALNEANREFALDATRFVADHPLAAHYRSAQNALESSSFMDIKALEERILSALDNRNGYSFIRIGDGEGRYIGDLSNYPSLATATAKIANRIWFWNSRCAPDSPFRDRLLQAYSRADAVGINPPFRVELEYRNNVLGYAGVVAGNDYVFDLSGHPRGGQSLTYNWANGLLDDRGFFQKIFERCDLVTVISPHSDIELALRARGAVATKALVIPSENNRLVVQRSRSDPHYPQVYHEVLEAIRVLRPRLCLIAGGVFGKIYCDEVKLYGGVAIDIGSIADRWVGIHTR